MIERAAFGGQAAGTEKLDNMLGFPDGVAGIDFSNRLRQQAERFGAELFQAFEIIGVSLYTILIRNKNHTSKSYLRVMTEGVRFSIFFRKWQ